ncbi:unnamed protein product [Prunus armeniaca]|uniref:A20-type domain-containing protein n=1 Tax=Prunus armeniaca TaxID=36596 RepID=A0A6J5U079_PRUAR|nr:unnamed protein product [Prunus armeniaca]
MNMEPPMCAKGCGFYGCVENKNMCSKCYKDHVKQENPNAQSTTVASSVEKTDLGSIARGISLLSYQNDSVSNTNDNIVDQRKTGVKAATERLEFWGLNAVVVECFAESIGIQKHTRAIWISSRLEEMFWPSKTLFARVTSCSAGYRDSLSTFSILVLVPVLVPD